MKIETLAVHASDQRDPHTGAVTAPIYLSTTFERAADGTFPHGYIYARTNNPNRAALERALMVLENGEAALAFASGSAATMAIFQCLRPGDHVLAPQDAYFGTNVLLFELFGRWGLEVTSVDFTNLHEVRAALRPHTKLIWTETPSNPLLKITDLAAIVEIARSHGIRSVCDNTWATPVLQQPLALGFDLVVHATTKYLGGHSDVLGGGVVARSQDEFVQLLRAVQTTGGAVPSPFEAWLTLRGIRTLPLRIRTQCATARRVAEFLAAHPRIEAVHYPGLATHPGHEIARRQMDDFGAMLSFQVRGGRPESMAVAARTQLFTRATSLGGTESLIEHRASVERPNTRTPQNLLRISIGLEHADDLIQDLEHALTPDV